MVWPLLKIGALALKSLAKPIAKKIKEAAIKNEKFRDYCLRLGSGWRRAENRLAIFSGEAPQIQIKDQKAVDLAADLLSEGFLLFVATGLLLWETKHANAKQEKKDAATLKRFLKLEEELEDNRKQLQALKQETQQLSLVKATNQERQQQEQQQRQNLVPILLQKPLNIPPI